MTYSRSASGSRKRTSAPLACRICCRCSWVNSIIFTSSRHHVTKALALFATLAPSMFLEELDALPHRGADGACVVAGNLHCLHVQIFFLGQLGSFGRADPEIYLLTAEILPHATLEALCECKG